VQCESESAPSESVSLSFKSIQIEQRIVDPSSADAKTVTVEYDTEAHQLKQAVPLTTPHCDYMGPVGGAQDSTDDEWASS